MFSDQNNYVDSNPAFHIYTDIDYDFECGGISRVSFIQFYGSWISYVYKKIKKVDLDLSTASMSHNDDESIESNIFTLCFALSIMGRKALASASHQGHGAQEPVRIELFLHGLHSLFQVRIYRGVQLEQFQKRSIGIARTDPVGVNRNQVNQFYRGHHSTVYHLVIGEHIRVQHLVLG